MVIQPFRLEEHLMGFAVGKALYLVLDRRAVARPLTGDLATIDSRQMQRFRNDPVGFGRCSCNAAGNLWNCDPVSQRRERHRRVVCRLHFKHVPGDGPSVKPRRRASLQPADGKIEGAKPLCQRIGRRLADPACRGDLGSQMDQASEKSPGGQHHGAGAPFATILGDDAATGAVLDGKVAHRRLDDGHTGGGDKFLHRLAIEFPVGLGARAMHRRTTRLVQHPELDARPVDRPAHDPVEGVDLAHKMALAKPADGRVAGHLADAVGAHRHEGRPCAHARGGGGCFAARMTPANDDDVKIHGLVPFGRPKSVQGRFMRPLRSFSNAKAGKYTAKKFLGVNLAGDPAEAVGCAPVVFRRQFGRHREIMAEGSLQSGHGILQRRAVPFTRDQA